MMKTIILILLISFISINYSSYSLDSIDCLEMVYPNEDGGYNPDSVMVDTCLQSSTYRKWFAKRTYDFVMQIYVFGNEALKMDTVVTWQDISSTYTEIKKGFQNLEQLFGEYVIKRSSDGYNNDSMYLQHPVFDLEFPDYFQVDSVCNVINNIDSCGSTMLSRSPGFNFVKEGTKDYIDFPFLINLINHENLIISMKNNSIDYNEDIKIYNLFGKLIERIPLKNMNEISIDISNWANGVYIVSFCKYTQVIII